ncbi:hypothetical protein WMQ22_25305, partial [Escherichia coli]|uniref:hypothetical protein n=1 Tax=Escherichia coli TaxID=562 RepID=UPI0034A15E7E
MPDYLAVGNNQDFIRFPMTPQTAQRIADAFGCSLPTKKMVDAIYQQAQVKREPLPLTERREAVSSFVEHNALIEKPLGSEKRGLLTAGIKKDIVITNRLQEKENRVAIYGWHRLSGVPIQPLTIVHHDT